MAVAAAGRKNFEWSGVYIPAAARLFGGEQLYPTNTGFSYPPFAAMVAAPFVSLPMWLANVIFNLISFAAMFLIVRLSWRLAGGRSLPQEDGGFKREIWIAVLACLCALRFSFNALSHGQSDLLIALLVIGGTF